MMTEKEMKNFTRIYLNMEPIGEKEIARMEEGKEAMEGYEQAGMLLYDKLDGRKKELLGDMMAYHSKMLVCQNVYYLWRGYLMGKKEREG